MKSLKRLEPSIQETRPPNTPSLSLVFQGQQFHPRCFWTSYPRVIECWRSRRQRRQPVNNVERLRRAADDRQTRTASIRKKVSSWAFVASDILGLPKAFRKMLEGPPHLTFVGRTLPLILVTQKHQQTRILTLGWLGKARRHWSIQNTYQWDSRVAVNKNKLLPPIPIKHSPPTSQTVPWFPENVPRCPT